MEATLTECERAWISYARKVLAQDSGCKCDRDEIAWPGFIGPKFAAGQVLIFGAIHEIDALKSSGIYDIAPAAKYWANIARTTTAEDRAYLNLNFEAYKIAIPRWLHYINKDGKPVRGAVWSHIQAVITALRLNFSQMAFTNLAKCGIPTGSADVSRTRKHEAATPAMTLIEALKPKYVIVAADNADVRKIVKIEHKDNEFVFRQCTNLTFKSGDLRRDEWLSKDLPLYRALMTTQGERETACSV